MKPARFEYIAPKTEDEAIAALVRYDGNARLLAGGQSLIPLLNLRVARPEALIDLGQCSGLAELHRHDNRLICGTMVRQHDAEHSALVAECCPLLAKTIRYLGPPTIRNRATIGGTLAHADRIAELPAAATALEAEMVAKGPRGERLIAAKDFFLGDLTTALEGDEMLREIRFPVSARDSRSSFIEMTNRHHDLALVGVAAYLELNPTGLVTKARLVAIGIGPTPVRLLSAEGRLVNARLDEEAIAEAGHAGASDCDPEDDLHASAAYRKSVLPHAVSRALAEARGGER
jgi:carbon-monoxide dehydrogenase medium subunit